MRNHMDHPKQLIPLGQVFNLPLPEEMAIPGMMAGNPYCPKIDPDYVFDIERFRDLLTFWSMKFKALKIIGNPSAGKTSIVEQWHARLGLPLFIVPCHENMTDTDLIGQFVPQENGTLKWVDSPVMAVYRNGGSVLLDEWNNLNPNAATILNAMLEGYAVAIPQTGEVIQPHETARFYATQNPVDGKVAVQGRYVQDGASDERFMEIWVDYLESSLEEQIVIKQLQRIGCELNLEALKLSASQMVKVANEIRKKFLNNQDPLNCDFHKPMSTRVLIRWALLAYAYRNVTSENPTIRALNRAFSGCSSEMKQAVKMLVKTTLGLPDAQ